MKLEFTLLNSQMKKHDTLIESISTIERIHSVQKYCRRINEGQK